MQFQVLFLIIFNIYLAVVGDQSTFLWRWTCTEKNLCVRNSPNLEATRSPEKTQYTSIEVCRLVCGEYGAIWPIPTLAMTKSNDLIKFDPSKTIFKIETTDRDVNDILTENTEIFTKNILAECGGNCTTESNDDVITITIIVTSIDCTLTLRTNEAYEVKSKGLNYEIKAATVFGARHGLETVSQLVAAYPISPTQKSVLIVKDVHIRDKPVYPHRSLLLDTARNYLSIAAIKRQIDGMAASKLNVLHWHATDTQSFPFESKRVPNLSKLGAYSENKIYSPTDVKDMLRYAKVRGIRVIMEIDAPAHAGNGWQWGPEAGLGNLSVCINQQPWRSYCIQPPCGQLNPANQNTYTVLRDLYKDIIEQFPRNEMFHMGGDEIFFPCWNTTPEIVNYLKSQGKGQTMNDFLDLWGEFQQKVLDIYDGIVGNTDTDILLWSSDLTMPNVIEKYLDKNRYIIQTWVPSTDPLPKELLDKGYKLIISTKNAWYLDHGFWGVTQYYTWRTAYTNRILKHKNVLGGEVCMWAELVDEHIIDGRIWPRSAAAAERLWADPSTNTQQAEPRMYRHRERLVSRGIQAEALAPQWCYQNEGQCL